MQFFHFSEEQFFCNKSFFLHSFKEPVRIQKEHVIFNVMFVIQCCLKCALNWSMILKRFRSSQLKNVSSLVNLCSVQLHWLPALSLHPKKIPRHSSSSVPVRRHHRCCIGAHNGNGQEPEKTTLRRTMSGFAWCLFPVRSPPGRRVRKGSPVRQVSPPVHVPVAEGSLVVRSSVPVVSWRRSSASTSRRRPRIRPCSSHRRRNVQREQSAAQISAEDFTFSGSLKMLSKLTSLCLYFFQVVVQC